MEGDDEVKATETHACTWYPVSNMVGHPKPGEVVRRARSPTWRANCQYSVSPAGKFATASLLRMVMQGFDPRIYTGSGRMSLRPVRALALLHSKFAVGVTNRRERERGSQVSGGKRVGMCVCGGGVDRLGSVPLHGTPPIPFIAQGRPGGRIQKGRKSERGSDASLPSLLLVGRP